MVSGKRKRAYEKARGKRGEERKQGEEKGRNVDFDSHTLSLALGNHNCSCGAAVYQAAQKKAQKSGRQAVEAGVRVCRDECGRRTPDRTGKRESPGFRAIGKRLFFTES